MKGTIRYDNFVGYFRSSIYFDYIFNFTYRSTKQHATKTHHHIIINIIISFKCLSLLSVYTNY